MSQNIRKVSEKKLRKKKYKRRIWNGRPNKADSKYTGGDEERKVKIRKNSLVGLFIFHDWNWTFLLTSSK